MAKNIKSHGWFAVHRGEDLRTLQEHCPNGLLLLIQISRRVRLTSYPIQGLEVGEALIGDYKQAGLTEQQYRTAKKKLEKFGYATFRTTNRGTIAKLVKSTIFDPLSEHTNRQSNEQLSDKQQAAIGQATTNKNGNKERIEKFNNFSFVSDDTEKLLKSLWDSSPAQARKRSSRKQVAQAWSRVKAADRPDAATLVNAMRAWRNDHEWKKDGGQFIPGLHQWVKNEKWSDLPQTSSALSMDATARNPNGNLF